MSISFLYPVFLWLLLLLPLFVGLGWPERARPDYRQRWVALLLRSLVLVGLVLALAGAQLERSIDRITTVFVLDVSDSVGVVERARGEDFLRRALAAKPEGDRAGLVLFGGEALVERLPDEADSMPALSSIPARNATDIEQAIRLGLALLPAEGGGRLLLLSDGQQTAGEARRLLNLAEARGIEIAAYPLGDLEAGAVETLVERLTAPAQARQGESVPVEGVIAANRPGPAALRLLVDGVPVESRPVQLSRGRNRFRFNVPLAEPGFHRLRLELQAEEDTRLQNNWGGAAVTVYGPPQLLVVEGSEGEAAPLMAALAAADRQATRTAPGALPDTPTGLAPYEAVILMNVPANALSRPVQENLVRFVRDLGRGLVMVGGPESYGAGGYLRSPLEKALPVDMEVRSRSREPTIALALAVDKSGSMGACHCDNPDLNQSYIRRPSGLPKIDIAKEAIFQAAQVLGDTDYLGVVAFDEAARWAVETAPRLDSYSLEQAIGGITANGQTNIFAGLIAAESSLLDAPARIKHIILLTDGWSHAGAYEELTARLQAEGITLSVVAAGQGSAEYLTGLAERGGGQYYPAATMEDVPRIFLKETVRAVGDYIIEEPFLPAPTGVGSPILRGLDLAEAPPLLGYNGATPKAAARLVLLTPRSDPLLATWQYGLGRSAAWSSDLGGRWAKEWLDWPDFPRFAAQLVGWTLPTPGDERMDLQISVQGDRLSLAANIQNQAGQPRNFLDVSARILAEGDQPFEMALTPTGPGQYQATDTWPEPGVYLAQVTAYEAGGEPVAGRTTGLVIPYSAEYATLEPDLSLLADLSGGHILVEPAQAFAHTLPLSRRVSVLWPWLLLLTALLFPFDVAARRLRLGRREWRQARNWLAERTPLRPGATRPETESSPLLGDLFRARQRARERHQPPETPPPVVTRPADAPSQTKAPAPSNDEEGEDTLARLREAKKRAKR